MICNLCGCPKTVEEMAIKRGTPSCSCRDCVSKRAMEYKRSPNGLVTKIYAHQRSHSRSRGHNPPTYTNVELREWMLSQANFNELYAVWVDNDYDKFLQPSIDRRDDKLGYSFCNIRLITWGENESAGHAVNNKVNRKVVRRSDGAEWGSLSDAATATNGDRNNISKACRSGNLHKGYLWEFAVVS